MALIKCFECGREILDAAATCPQCGAPVRGAAVFAAPILMSWYRLKTGPVWYRRSGAV